MPSDHWVMPGELIAKADQIRLSIAWTTDEEMQRHLRVSAEELDAQAAAAGWRASAD